jgi:DNA-binding transcriptional regulator YdaS (Cro superfamily)
LRSNFVNKQRQVVQSDFSNGFHNLLKAKRLKAAMCGALKKKLPAVKRLAYTARMKLFDYVSKHGSKTELARAIGAQPQLVWQWATGVRPVPLERCVPIEVATEGVVSREELRPDDWQNIWPELVNRAQPNQPTAQEA